MSDLAIKTSSLSKRYRIGIREKYPTIREALMRAAMTSLRAAWSWTSNCNNGTGQGWIWALRDVDFEVKQGEVVGIIGPNGAGKSTLLKVLSGITEPTKGYADIYGRVGSLLDVGTGFHMELTGRENIFMNGALLGMRRQEIKRKFDEIVDFSGVEKFIDTPVKHYSSGMYVRLAFAVSAHLEPEILLVDEVLAVGDAEFQKKCLGKMGDVAKEGRTLLFVSHNMIAIQSLCQRVIWLNDGEIVQEGQPGQIVFNYLQSSSVGLKTEQVWNDIATAPGNDLVRLHRISVRHEGDSPSDPIRMQTPFLIEVEYWNLVPDSRLHITLHLYTEQEIIAFTTGSAQDPKWRGHSLQTGLYRSVCYIPGNLLNSGRHRVKVCIIKDLGRHIYDHENALSFDVFDSSAREGGWFGREPGVLSPLLNWTTQFLTPIAEHHSSD